MTQPTYADDRMHAGHPAAPGDIDAVVGDRLRTLEEEIFTLRETMGRFADLVLGDLKKIRETSAQPRSMPPSMQMPTLVAPAAPTDSTISEAVKRKRHRWMAWDILDEMQTTLRLYFDPTYRMSRSARIMIPGMLALFVVNYLMFSQFFVIPIVAPILSKVIDVFLVIVLYRIVSREVVRYREAMAGIAAWLHATASPGRRSVVSDEGPSTRLEME